MTELDPLFTAGLDLLQRMDVRAFRIGYSDEEDGDPTVWYAVVQVADGGMEAEGALSPLQALVRLLERMVDGGRCVHCKKATALSADPVAHPVETASDAVLCWYRYDPELNTFRRSCEGRS